jgi:hypothetical protein
MIDELLEKIGLKYEDLNSAERETLNTWTEALEKNKLTLEGVKTYISSMRDAVDQELTKTDYNSKQDLFLKARLRNYMLLEAFLSTPEKAKKAIEKSIASFASKVR